MGYQEEGRVQISRDERESRHCTCGRNKTKVEDNGVFKDVAKGVIKRYPILMETLSASEKQIGGSHYKDMPIQPSEYITKNGIGWYEGNAIKYISRYKQKGGKADIEKAVHYLELLLETLD